MTMKIKSILLLLLMLTTTGNLFAQKLFTLEELNFGGKNASQFSPERWKLRWEGEKLVDAADRTAATVIDPKTGKEITGETLNLDAQKRSRHEGELEYCKASGAVAFLRDKNLWVATADGTEHQLSADGSREIVYGQSVHRDEFGIYKGTFWSPDGQQLAFYRMDQSMVADYPQVDIFGRIATLEPDKYPMAGETSHVVTVGIYDLHTQKTMYLKTGAAETDDYQPVYFTNIAWSPDSKTLFIFDEPTTGLHFHDVQKLLRSFDALIGKGHTVLVVEHNLDVIRAADWVIDLGPDAGDRGGEVVFEGTPEDLKKQGKTFTAKYL